MKKLWFKSKRYGWGWCPCSWEGWLVTGLYLVLVIVLAINVEKMQIHNFLLALLVLIITLIFFCYKTGEKPRWRWGK